METLFLLQPIVEKRKCMHVEGAKRLGAFFS